MLFLFDCQFKGMARAGGGGGERCSELGEGEVPTDEGADLGHIPGHKELEARSGVRQRIQHRPLLLRGSPAHHVHTGPLTQSRGEHGMSSQCCN